MTTYKFDDQTIEASSVGELVRKMHESSWAQSGDDRDFMRSIADRLVLQSSLDIRCDTAENFVEDLIKYDVLKVQ